MCHKAMGNISKVYDIFDDMERLGIAPVPECVVLIVRLKIIAGIYHCLTAYISTPDHMSR